MVEWMHDRMHGWVNVCAGRLLVVAWAYGRLSHARGPTADRLTGFYATPEAQQVYYQQTTNTLIHPIMHPITHPSNLTCVHSPTHPFTHPIHSPPIHSPTPSIRPPHSFTNSSIHPSIYLIHLLHPPIHPPIHLPHPSTSSIYPILPAIHLSHPST